MKDLNSSMQNIDHQQRKANSRHSHLDNQTDTNDRKSKNAGLFEKEMTYTEIRRVIKHNI